jgi:RNA 2',3'-cyclic 3'-phosphodiesterase
MNNPPQKIRAFIAVPLPERVRSQVKELQQDLGRRGTPLRWVSPENLHLTLKFLGDIEPAVAEQLGERLEEILHPVAPFRVSYRQIGAFPNMQAPRVFWVGIGQGRQQLEQLAESISTLVKEFPTQADNKKFRAHLTIGRSRRGRPQPIHLPRKILELSFGQCDVDRVQLVKSVLGPTGPVYTVLKDCRLAGGKNILDSSAGN